MSDNLELWNAVSRVPPEHLKGFTRGGGFKGTAIKPMWSIKAMTEHFGPCGEGWFTDKPEFQLVDAGAEKLVFCTLGVWVKGQQKVYGVGGDKVIVQFSSGAKADDEALKKAYTDALTNALKLLGVGADIHMGLWDGNKYVDEGDGGAANDAQRTKNPMDKPVTKEETRALKDELCREIEAHTSAMKLRDWAKVPENRSRKASLHPDFQDVVSQSWLDKLGELEKGLAA